MNATAVEFITELPYNNTIIDHLVHSTTKSPNRNGTVPDVPDRYTPQVTFPGPVPLAIYIVAPTLLIFLFSLLRCLTKFIRNLLGHENEHRNNRQDFTPREGQQVQKNDTLKKRLVEKFILLKKISSSSQGHSKEDVEANVKELSEETTETNQAVGQENFVTDDRSCPICFDQYGEKTEEVFIGQLKKCGHFYHFDCIWPWLEQKGSCPLCRENIKLKETDIRGTTLEHVLAKKKEDARKKNKQSTKNNVNETTNGTKETNSGLSGTCENNTIAENDATQKTGDDVKVCDGTKENINDTEEVTVTV